MEFNDKDIERFLRLIYTGKSTEYALDEGMYFAIADYLKKGLYEGFGISFNELKETIEKGVETVFDAADLELLTELRENLYMFSSAKTFQETKDFTGALVDSEGKVRTFKEFKEFAMPINEQWNVNWLKTEYETAYGQAQNAVRWNEIEKNKEVLPVLTFETTEDDRVCEICGPMHGLTANVDDPIWDTCTPMLHFRCFCTLSQHTDDVALTPEPEREALQSGAESRMQDLFKMNPGKEKVVFSKDHPYFDVESKDKAFARNNFGLPIPENDN